MNTRKIALLAVFAFLLIVCIAQTIMGTISPVKTIKTDAAPDAITITKDNQKVELIKKNNIWFVGQDNYLANKTDVNNMIRFIQEIKILDKIGKTGNEEIDEKYSLTDSKATFVAVYKDGKEIQNLKLGKTSSTNSQTYGSIGGKKDIYLLSGNLTSVFTKTATELRGKTAFTVEEKDIASVTISKGDNAWTVTKTSKKGDGEWALSGSATGTLDNSAVNSWIRQAAFLNIAEWAEDSMVLPSNKYTSFQITTTSNATINVDIYEVKTGDETKFFGTCSTTTHKFELAKTQADKFAKDVNDLLVKE